MQTPYDATREALSRISEIGADLTKPMEMDFFVAIPSENDGEKVALIVRSLGFTVSVEQDDETLRWTCYCTKSLIPEYSEVAAIEQQLDSIAKPFGGYADGFGSYGNAEKTSESGS